MGNKPDSHFMSETSHDMESQGLGQKSCWSGLWPLPPGATCQGTGGRVGRGYVVLKFSYDTCSASPPLASDTWHCLKMPIPVSPQLCCFSRSHCWECGRFISPWWCCGLASTTLVRASVKELGQVPPLWSCPYTGAEGGHREGPGR